MSSIHNAWCGLPSWLINDKTIRDQTWTYPIRNTIFLCHRTIYQLLLYQRLSRQPTWHWGVLGRGQQKAWFKSGLRIRRSLSLSCCHFICIPFWCNILIHWEGCIIGNSVRVDVSSGLQLSRQHISLCIFNLLTWIHSASRLNLMVILFTVNACFEGIVDLGRWRLGKS